MLKYFKTQGTNSSKYFKNPNLTDTTAKFSSILHKCN